MDVSTNAIIRALSADSVIPAQNDYDSDDSFVSAISYQLANSTEGIPVLFDSILNNSSQPSSCYEDFQRMDDSSHTSNAARAPSSCFVPLPPTDDSFPNNDSSHRANSSHLHLPPMTVLSLTPHYHPLVMTKCKARELAALEAMQTLKDHSSSLHPYK